MNSDSNQLGMKCRAHFLGFYSLLTLSYKIVVTAGFLVYRHSYRSQFEPKLEYHSSSGTDETENESIFRIK